MQTEGKNVSMDIENETFIEKSDPGELCRLCANTDNQLIPIFKGEGIEHNIPNKIEQHLPIIKVTELDKLPLQICYQCASTLIAWHNLYEGSKIADKRLREVLSIDEKPCQSEEPYENYADDFHDDYDDQSSNNFLENVQLNSASTSSQPEDLQQNVTSEINQLNDEKTSNETENNNPTDERCLRWTYESTKNAEDNSANISGTGSGSHQNFHTKDRFIDGFLTRRIEIRGKKGKQCPTDICVCIWSNDYCSKCSMYDNFKCGYCPMVFFESHLRNRHLRTSHVDLLLNYCLDWIFRNSAVCTNKNTENVNDLTSKTLQYQCAECSAPFFDKIALIEHIRLHKKRTNEVTSPITLSTFKQSTRAKKNWPRRGPVRDANRQKQYQCEHCSKIVFTKATLKKHFIFHADLYRTTEGKKTNDDSLVNGGYYTCDVCSQIFLKRHSFTRHVNLHSSNRYDCDKCKKTFTSESVLNAHKNRKHKELPKNVFFLEGRKYLKCDQCSFTCRNERNKLEEHMRVHTGEKPFTCEQCGKQFRTKALLRVHHRYVHEGIKEHECDICGRCFSNKRYMEEHRRIHTGEKPLVCDLCGKTFRQNSSLSKHVENHLGIKRHSCHLCGKRFSNSHHLNIHVKRHMGEANHVCMHCGKRFVDQYQLKNHYVVHSEDRPFVCGLCGSGFKLLKHLKQHEKTHRS